MGTLPSCAPKRESSRLGSASARLAKVVGTGVVSCGSVPLIGSPARVRMPKVHGYGESELLREAQIQIVKVRYRKVRYR